VLVASLLLAVAAPAGRAVLLSAGDLSDTSILVPPAVDVPHSDEPNQMLGLAMQASAVPAPAPGPTRSVWDVTYTGFDTTAQGPQARVAFDAAVGIWSRIVSSSVPIKVNANFAQLATKVLGSARTSASYQQTQGGVTSWYPSALADAITGVDRSTQVTPVGPTSDIIATFTVNPALNCPTGQTCATWYFGTDGSPPAGAIDFQTVVLHEIGHGLGFNKRMTVDSAGNGSRTDPPQRFERFAYTASSGGTQLVDLGGVTEPSPALGQALTSGSVYWGGTNGVSANNGVRPRLHAPNPYVDGSTLAHLDEATYDNGSINSLMTPTVDPQEAIHSPGPAAVGMLIDAGWTASLPDPTAPGAPTGVVAGPGNAKSTVSWRRAPGNGATISEYRVTASPGGAQCIATTTLSCTVAGLTNGTPYTFTVTATNSVGTGAPSTPSAPKTPDGINPTVTTVALPLYSLGAVTFRWSGADTGGSGIKNYDVTVRRTSFNGIVAAATVSTTATSISPTPVRGATYAFTVRSRDKAGNVSPVSTTRFTGLPLDDRSLTASSGWTRTTSSAYYAGTATTVARTGVTLTRTSVKTRRLAIVATRTVGGGVMGVYLNGVLLKKISLNSTSTAHRRVYTVFSGTTLRGGNLVIKTLNSGRVTIDGVGLIAL